MVTGLLIATPRTSVETRRRRFSILPSTLAVAICAAYVVGAVLRATLGTGSPLWLDETWTGAISIQPTMRDVLHQAYEESGPPLYYILMHGWALLFGASNISLRLPSLLLGLAAPLLCLCPVAAIPGKARMIWSALSALYLPAIYYSQEARCYSLIFFLSVASMIALARLLERPTLGRAAVWALIGSIMCLTHYHAIFLIGCQGVAYLAFHPRPALRTWPAILLFAPAFGWLIYHLPRIHANVVWFQPFRFATLLDIGTFLMGSPLGVVFFAVLALAAIYATRHGSAANAPRFNPIPWLLVASTFAGLVGLVILAFVRPSFSPRYLLVFAPGVLLGFGLTLERVRRRWPPLPIVFILLAGCSAVRWQPNVNARAFNFQAASQSLIDSGVHNLVFFFDHPANVFEEPDQLAIVGGFFFRRAGIDVSVTPVKLRQGEDPNARLLAAATGKPYAGLLWIYNTNDGDVAASTTPPRIETLAPEWHCHDHGVGTVGILACWRKT